MGYRVRGDLKRAATKRGMTVADVGRRAGVSYSHVSAIFNGRVEPSPRIARAIASALEIPVADVFPDVFAA